MSAAGDRVDPGRVRRLRAMEASLGALPPEVLGSLDRGLARGHDALRLPETEHDTGPGSGAWDAWIEARKAIESKT